MSDLSNLKLFATKPHECSYLEDQQATTVFIDPDAELDGETYQQLSTLGFRRSGQHVYRPQCESCAACVPARIPVPVFQTSRSQRRCIKRNGDLSIRVVDALDIGVHYPLYEKYINSRHQDGDMYPATVDQFAGFLTQEWGITRYIEMWQRKKLIGVAVTDCMTDAYSAVYTFFDPDEDKRSIGTYAILLQIELALREQKQHLYLGYWIKECQKMAYKTQYRPLELLIKNRWCRLN